MKRGITVWEECEHGEIDSHPDRSKDMVRYGGSMPGWEYPECPGGRSVSLTLEKVDHVQGMTHLIDGSPPKVSLWIDDALLAVVDKEPQ